LQVVDDDNDRVELAEVPQQATDSEWHRQGVGVASVGLDPVHGDRQSATLWIRQSLVGPFGTADDQFREAREGQAAVELRRGHRENPSALAIGREGSCSQQAGLACTGVTYRDCASTPGQRLMHDAQGVVAAEEPERGSSVVHAPTSRSRVRIGAVEGFPRCLFG
jgi:hypothetical protein